MNVEQRLYNANKSRKNYEANKVDIMKRRILSRVVKGSKVYPSTIQDPKYAWTEDELELLEKSMKNRKDYLTVSDARILPTSDGNINFSGSENVPLHLLEEHDGNREHQNITSDRVQGLQITVQDVQLAFQLMIDTGLLLKNKNEIQRKIGKERYNSRISVAMNIFGSDNVLDVYVYPEKFYNKLLLSHLKPVSTKEYVSIFISLYKKSPHLPRDMGLNVSILDLQDKVLYSQMSILKQCMGNVIKLSKEEELVRLETATYYKWDDIMKVINVIENAFEHNPTSLTLLRDLVIASFYINENVLRDNLGAILIGNDKQEKSTDPDIIAQKYNYFDMKHKVLYLNDFKTNTQFKNFTLNISDKTLKYVQSYLKRVHEVTGEHPKYLVTKNDGTMYQDGKLSKYITDMFQRHTGAKHFTINDLRHSFSTYHRNSSLRTKERVAALLQHSFQQHVRYERHTEDKHCEFPIFRENEEPDEV